MTPLFSIIDLGKIIQINYSDPFDSYVLVRGNVLNKLIARRHTDVTAIAKIPLTKLLCILLNLFNKYSVNIPTQMPNKTRNNRLPARSVQLIMLPLKNIDV